MPNRPVPARNLFPLGVPFPSLPFQLRQHLLNILHALGDAVPQSSRKESRL
jgi:hypothetical protein